MLKGSVLFYWFVQWSLYYVEVFCRCLIGWMNNSVFHNFRNQASTCISQLNPLSIKRCHQLISHEHHFPLLISIVHATRSSIPFSIVQQVDVTSFDDGELFLTGNDWYWQFRSELCSELSRCDGHISNWQGIVDMKSTLNRRIHTLLALYWLQLLFRPRVCAEFLHNLKSNVLITSWVVFWRSAQVSPIIRPTSQW